MFRSPNSCSILYTIFGWFLGLCYGFVLLSAAAGHNDDIVLFKNEESLLYQYKTTVLMSEKSVDTKNVGFSLTGNVLVQVLWSANGKKLLKLQLESPQLHIRTRKGSSPNDFTPHSSALNTINNKPFLVTWENGRIANILLATNESVVLTNIKKGIATLLQVQLSESNTEEVDASGKCRVSYTLPTPTEIIKIKTACTSEDLETPQEQDDIFGTKRIFSSLTQYQLDAASAHFKSVKSKEFLVVYLSSKEEIGSQIEAEQSLTFVKRGTVNQIKAENIEGAISKIESTENTEYVKDSLLTKVENRVSERTSDFAKSVNNLRQFLKTEHLGSIKPTKAALRLVNLAKTSSAEDIVKALTQKKNKDILLQLYDILAYAQTEEAHKAVSKTIHLDKETHVDSNERYLWALSFSPFPNAEILKDLLKKFSKINNMPSKTKETLILCIASMARKLPKKHSKLFKEVEETILNNLEYAKNEERYTYFRALRNLQSPSTIPRLLSYIKKGSQKEGVLAWKVLRSMNPSDLDDTVLTAAKKSCFQLDRVYDSSSRALAVDILLDSKPNDNLLEDLLTFVASNDTAYEIRQYTFQRLKLKADKDKDFGSRVQRIIKSNPKINNYSGIAPRGLSTALERRFLTSSSSNGSIVSLQEIKSGIVKRGIVNINLEKGDFTKEIFSLGINAGGLSSFVSSNDGHSDETEEEAISAGMELSVAGNQIRPFVFFSGQGELMGHVWSGTASEMTPALQVLVLLQDQLEYSRLGAGFIAKMELRVVVSFDLSGKIEISLWNRNAESLIQNSAGVLISGLTTIDSTIITSQVDYMGTTEIKLDCKSDIDFSSNVKFCMRLSQPNSVFRYNVFKTERIPNTKFSVRISNYRISQIPGVTYSINKKNNEMCSSIFS